MCEDGAQQQIYSAIHINGMRCVQVEPLLRRFTAVLTHGLLLFRRVRIHRRWYPCKAQAGRYNVHN